VSVKIPIPDHIATLPSYVPGATPLAGRRAYKLSSNESPFPPLPGIIAAVADAAADLNRYPDVFSTDLAQALARHHDVDPARIIVGNGSEAVLEHTLKTLAGPSSEVVLAWRSFEAYPIAIQLAGATAVRVGLDEHAQHNLAAMAEAVTDRTSVVLLCSPNNPTGPVLKMDDVEDFLTRMPPHVLVVLDEAYREFVRDPEAADGLDLASRHANLMVLRTFSKAYGMAGLRCGYAIGRPRIIAALRNAQTPFSVNIAAQRAALTALTLQVEMQARVEAIIDERDRMADALRSQGWVIPETHANFVWLPAGANAVPLGQAAASAGVLVRPFDGDGVRVTAGEREGIDAFLTVAASWV